MQDNNYYIFGCNSICFAEVDMEEIKKRGGKREGAGRPKGIKVPYKAVNTSIPEEYAARLKILTEKTNITVGQILKRYVDDNWNAFDNQKEDK